MDELLAELHASENEPNSRAFAGAGRQCRGGGAAAPASSDVSDAMSRMQERLNRLNGEVQAQPIGSCRPGLPPRHGRRAGVAAAADEPAARRRGGSEEAVGGTEWVALAALEQAARHDARRETALRQRVAALRQQLEPVAATAPAAEGAAAAAVAVKRPAAPAAAEAQGRQLSAAVGRRVAQLKRQAGARAAVLDGLECEARRLQQQLQQQVEEGGAPPAAPAAPAPAAKPMGQPARLLCMLRRINEATGAAEVGTAPLAPGAHGLGRVHGLGAASASAQRACVPCSVFSDGVMMHRGPFRPYAEAAPFVREVMAGYLPYELKQRHPDGLLFEPLLDFCHATYAEASASAVAARGGGGGLGGGGGVMDLQALHAGSDLLVPQGRLLERLPKSVMRNGTVVPVRDEIAALVGGRGAEAGAPAPDAEAVRAARLRRFAR